MLEGYRSSAVASRAAAERHETLVRVAARHGGLDAVRDLSRVRVVTLSARVASAKFVTTNS
jgi:hypothetical protein